MQTLVSVAWVCLYWKQAYLCHILPFSFLLSEIQLNAFHLFQVWLLYSCNSLHTAGAERLCTALILFDENASISVMALSLCLMSLCVWLRPLPGKSKKDIWSLSCSMNTVSFSLCTGLKHFSVMTQLPAWVQIAEIQQFSYSGPRLINITENKSCLFLVVLEEGQSD